MVFEETTFPTTFSPERREKHKTKTNQYQIQHRINKLSNIPTQTRWELIPTSIECLKLILWIPQFEWRVYNIKNHKTRESLTLISEKWEENPKSHTLALKQYNDDENFALRKRNQPTCICLFRFISSNCLE